jgi:hypothetical protein
MMGGYWYVPGNDGRRYCYAKEPTFVCPVGNVKLEGPDDPEPGHYVVTETVEQAAMLLGVEPRFLTGKLRHSAERSRVDGRLTDACASCGHKLERLGYRIWVEAKAPKDGAASRINRRLGGDGFVTVEGSWYRGTKKEAQEWAHMRAGADQ